MRIWCTASQVSTYMQYGVSRLNENDHISYHSKQGSKNPMKTDTPYIDTPSIVLHIECLA